jgi:hypothetical protein
VAKLPAMFGTRKPFCNVGREMYYWSNEGTTHGGDYVAFRRVGGTWRAQGPFEMGHDDEIREVSP